MSVVADTVYKILTVLQILFIFFFCISFFNKKSPYRTPYFIIYTVGLVVSVVTNIDYIFYTMSFRPFHKFISITINVYGFIFPVILHSTLILNRCTALWFPLKLQNIWNFWNTFAIILFNLCFPPILFGYYLFKVYSSTSIFKEDDHINAIIQIYFTTFACIFMIAIVLICYQKTITTVSKNLAKIEKRLIYQSILILIFIEFDVLIWRINHIFDIYFKTFFPEIFVIGEYVILTYQLLDLIILFFVSEQFRTAFIKFYTFGLLGSKWVVMIPRVSNTQSFNAGGGIKPGTINIS